MRRRRRRDRDRRPDEHHVLTRGRVAGLLVGIAGVALVVGAASGDGDVRLLNVAEVLVVAVCYAVAPFITDRKLAEDGLVKPRVDAEYPLSGWREAFETLAQRKVVGKTIIRPDL